LEEWNDPRTFRGYMQTSASTQNLERSNSTASSNYSFDAADEKAGTGGQGLTRGNTNAGLTRGNTNAGLTRGNTNAGVQRGNTIRQFEKTYPFEQGDGLREDGRGYRGF
jgi:hypothetical protein